MPIARCALAISRKGHRVSVTARDSYSVRLLSSSSGFHSSADNQTIFSDCGSVGSLEYLEDPEWHLREPGPEKHNERLRVDCTYVPRRSTATTMVCGLA